MQAGCYSAAEAQSDHGPKVAGIVERLPAARLTIGQHLHVLIHLQQWHQNLCQQLPVLCRSTCVSRVPKGTKQCAVHEWMLL